MGRETMCPRQIQGRMDILEQWRIARVLPLIKGRLLDLGCGFNNLVRAYGSGVGTDVFPWEGIDVLVGNSALLPFPDDSFDTVTIVAALNHIPNRAQVLLEVRRVLRFDGKLIITMIGPRTGFLAHAVFARDEQRRGGMHPNEKKGMTRQQVLTLLGQCGFTTTSQIAFQLHLNRVFVAVKSQNRKDVKGCPEPTLTCRN
jgi:SAM-dependent methyltransferase